MFKRKSITMTLTYLRIAILTGLLTITANVSSQVMIDETTVDTNTVITGLDIPWEIQYGHDGWLWVTERYGRVSRIHPETGEQDIILNHSGTVTQQGESGMLGMAFHPDFPDDPRIYIVYTYSDNGIKERLVHFTYNGSELVDETILIEGIQGNNIHDGSRLVFAPDGKLMMTTGDANNLSAPQNPENLNGKILRINPDGTIPNDNPFGDSFVYTWGHRNAQGLDYAPDGTLYSSEHGPNSDDEINLIEEGRNYGWPDVMGYCDTPGEQEFCDEFNVKEPMTAWTPTIAPSDIIYYDHDMIPEWTGSILLTVLKNKRVVELELSDDGQDITGKNHYFINYWGRLRDICAGPEGEIYLATNGDSWSNNNPFTHSIIRLKAGSSTGDYHKGSQKPFRISVNSHTGTLVVETNESLASANWYIVDIMGRVKDSGRIEQSRMVLETSFEPGVYVFKIDGSQSKPLADKFFIH